jgi:hypothetical protein|tara:strand:- start:78 stop:359 length:282 start_codon:yes stop_codon:yes gene_type:complete
MSLAWRKHRLRLNPFSYKRTDKGFYDTEYKVFYHGVEIGHVSKLKDYVWQAVAIDPVTEYGHRVENGWTLFYRTRQEATWAINGYRNKKAVLV